MASSCVNGPLVPMICLRAMLNTNARRKELRRALSSRRSAGVGILRSRGTTSLNLSSMNATLQKQILPGDFESCAGQQQAKTRTTLQSRSTYLRRSRSGGGAFISCKAVVESGSSAGTTADDKSSHSGSEPMGDEPVKDGTILTGDGSELRSTLRLVECAMLAATAGLAYFLSNLLRLESYFGCFFPLPVVISSMRWGAAAGRKTMVATAMLLLILSGPLKAASYLLMHGFVGLSMGALWKWNVNWGLSIAGCTVVISNFTYGGSLLSLNLAGAALATARVGYIREHRSSSWSSSQRSKVRCLGALGFVLLSSWLLRDNILALITMNAHASLSYMLAAVGMNFVPTMPMIYVVFASLLVVNCGSFVFLLHVLYAIFLRRLGMRGSISVPGWVERAM